ncbi:uncharacterized protein EV422DRAFT_571735 [Fimicolochytrium jonesii]|uniref:uncharacterized protein n=1 Tax=Fimicolochytrium jonesii TaxID=1396493 RepID=UPI0022FE02A2|nr:uncharacterized protein EV422DRAFT_571735 [Fimicolochytrium jonesii]KAI8816360.1 hypothetical protein EV422DRAFT_571735 [Fimicolochytrium jonesii]
MAAQCSAIVTSTLPIEDRAVAELVLSQLEGTVVRTTGSEPLKWHAYNDVAGIWEVKDAGVIARLIFDSIAEESRQLQTYYEAERKKLVSADAEGTDEAQGKQNKKELDRLIGRAKALYSHVSANRTMSSTLRKLQDDICDDRVRKLWDTRDDLLHFSNGVYDFSKTEFRKSSPQDYSTRALTLEYVPYAQHPPHKKAAVKKFFSDITLDNQELEDFLLKILASILHGDDPNQLGFFFAGSGSNGKSALIRLLNHALGPYCTSLSTALLGSEPNNGNAASPALMQLKGMRGAFATEYERPTMETGFIKSWIGRDQHTARENYGSNENFTIKATFLLALNNMPIIRDKTHGFWRKLCKIPFNAEFVSHTPNMPNERESSPDFEKKHLLPAADTFLALLVDVYYPRYESEGMKRSVWPQCVIDATDEYRHTQNTAAEFFENYVRPPTSQEHYITCSAFDALFVKFCEKKGIPSGKHIVGLRDLMDKKYLPGKDPKDKNCHNFHVPPSFGEAKGKTIRGWKCVVSQEWKVEDPKDAEEPGER